MIYGGLTYPTSPVSLGNSIASSDNGFPLQLAGGVSFQGIATDGPFHVTRISQLGQQLLLYCTGPLSGNMNSPDDMSGAVVSASFVGFPTIWAFADVIHTRGPISGTLVAEFPDRHQFLAVDGEYRYNGLFTQIMNDQVWRVVLANYDTTKPGSAFVAISFEFGDLIWALPLKTDAADQLHPSTAYVEHYMEQANSYLFKPMTQRDFPFTCAALFQNSGVTTWLSFDGTTEPTWNLVNSSWISWNFRGNTPVLVAGGIDGDIYNLYQTDTQEGTPALATCTWGGRVIGNARARALVKRVYPEIEYINDPASRVSVTLTMQDALGGPTTITDTQTFNPDYSGNRFTTHYRRGRVATVTISDNQGLGWICDGYDFDWVNGGLR
jgi:hypothetical protein